MIEKNKLLRTQSLRAFLGNAGRNALHFRCVNRHAVYPADPAGNRTSKNFALTCGLMAAFWLCVCPSFDSGLAQQSAAEKKIIDALAQSSTQFSAAYMKGDAEKMVSHYTDDAVIFPGNSDLIRGKEAIRKYWTLAPGRTISHHKITAVEIKITGDFAYDYGYYEISGANNGQAWGPNYGKYLIVWKRGSDGAWKMHLDMWNSRPKPE